MEKLLTVKEAAAILSVSPKTLYSWSETGEVPSLKFQGSVRFETEALQKWTKGKRRGYDMTAENVVERPKKGR